MEGSRATRTRKEAALGLPGSAESPYRATTRALPAASANTTSGGADDHTGGGGQRARPRPARRRAPRRCGAALTDRVDR